MPSALFSRFLAFRSRYERRCGYHLWRTRGAAVNCLFTLHGNRAELLSFLLFGSRREIDPSAFRPKRTRSSEYSQSNPKPIDPCHHSLSSHATNPIDRSIATSPQESIFQLRFPQHQHPFPSSTPKNWDTPTVSLLRIYGLHVTDLKSGVSLYRTAHTPFSSPSHAGSRYQLDITTPQNTITK